MLRFRLAGIPVGVHFSFLILLLLSPPSFRGVEVLMWGLAAFVAVLAHEMGHATVARRFGAEVSVTIMALGGYTTWATEQPVPPRRRFLISAAGSAIGIVSGGITFLAYRNDVIPFLDNRVWEAFILSFWWASLVWGVLNWLPIARLDGGHMLESFLEIVWPRRAAVAARVVSVVVGAVAIVFAVVYGAYLAAALVGLLLLSDLRRPAPTPEHPTPAGQTAPLGETATETAPAERPRPDFPI